MSVSASAPTSPSSPSPPLELMLVRALSLETPPSRIGISVDIAALAHLRSLPALSSIFSLFTDVTDTAISMSLSVKERGVLNRVQESLRCWGYRSAPDQDHEAYEVRSSSIRWIQELTDIVFRNLQQLSCEQQYFLRDSDGCRKATSIASGIRDVIDTDQKIVGAAFLRDFFTENPAALSAIMSLGNSRLENATGAFALIVVAARAMFALSSSYFPGDTVLDAIACLTMSQAQDEFNACIKCLGRAATFMQDANVMVMVKKKKIKTKTLFTTHIKAGKTPAVDKKRKRSCA